MSVPGLPTFFFRSRKELLRALGVSASSLDPNNIREDRREEGRRVSARSAASRFFRPTSKRDMERWVLYIASDRNSRKAYDAGSEACVKIVQTGGLADSVDVQDCDVLRRSKVTFPEWLEGTPTLYDGEERRAYLGIDAVVKLACIRPASRAAGRRRRREHAERRRGAAR